MTLIIRPPRCRFFLNVLYWQGTVIDDRRQSASRMMAPFPWQPGQGSPTLWLPFERRNFAFVFIGNREAGVRNDLDRTVIP
jgi:hypothetical protein